MFNTLDADGDGEITLDEFGKCDEVQLAAQFFSGVQRAARMQVELPSALPASNHFFLEIAKLSRCFTPSSSSTAKK